MRLLNALTLQRRRIRNTLSSRQKPLFLNLGSGPRGIDDRHWVNVDGFHDRHVHFLLDLTRPLPFPADTFDGVFCEHVLEHFSREDGERLAGEIRRILRSGGCLRVVVPDAELVLQRYSQAPADIVARRGETGKETPMEIVNSYFRQRYEHQFLYDWATLDALLTRAGFGKSVRVRFRQAELCPPIVLDDKKYDWESLYVEAVK